MKDRIIEAISSMAPYLAWGWGYLRAAWSRTVAGLDAIRRSAVALISSPAVWVAATTLFVVGFCVGHIEGSYGKRQLRSKVVALDTKAQRESERADMAERRAKDSGVRADEWKAKAEAVEAENVALRRQKPKASVVPPKQDTPVAAAPEPKPFWPWEQR